MTKMLKIGALALALLGGAALLVTQRMKIQQLEAECASLRDQLAQTASLKDDNERLGKQLKEVAENAQTEQKELSRLRGQAVRLRQVEQENTQLKALGRNLQQQIAARPATPAGSDPGQNPPAAPPAATNAPATGTTDLGSLELADGGPVRFDLGGGTNCVVTPKALSDGNVSMQLLMVLGNADGTTTDLGQGRITARPGQYCSISVGDRMIGLAVKIKPE
jgi:hypothetical protein